jgi:hypothetical protein
MSHEERIMVAEICRDVADQLDRGEAERRVRPRPLN